MPHVDSDDDAPPPRAAGCRACGHDHAPGTTCRVCGHHRRVDDADDDLPRPRLGHDEPIIEVIDKFLCLGAFEHTSKEDVLLACGIRTVMNVRFERTRAAGERREHREGRGDFDGNAGKGAGLGGPKARAGRARRSGEEASANGGDENEGARRRVGDDVGWADAIGERDAR